MCIKQITLPVRELSELEVVCPNCDSAFSTEGRQWLAPSCPVCDEAFGPRFTEAMQNYARFLESARALNVGVNFLVRVSQFEGKQEVTEISQEVAVASG